MMYLKFKKFINLVQAAYNIRKAKISAVQEVKS